jgi:hypothetical protein
MTEATTMKKRRRAGTHILLTGAAAIVMTPVPPAIVMSRTRVPKSRPRVASNPTADAPSAGPPKKKHVIKRKARPPVASETTTIDPQAGDHYVDHNVFDNMTQRYKT